MCSRNRSILALTAALAVSNLLVLSAAAAEGEQRPQVQKLLQAGSYEEAVGAAEGGDSASVYLAAQALLRLEQPDRAAAEFGKLAASGDAAWRLIGQSGQATVANDAGRAVDTARRAAEADGDNPFAHYQLGLSAVKAGDYATASSALSRSAELKPDFAYAHYYAGLAFQRQRQLPKAAQHFDAFLKLAPDAPERQAVQQIMRTLK